MSTLELNLKAKKTVVIQPQTPLVLGAVKLEAGKKYLTRSNLVMGPMQPIANPQYPFRDPQKHWIYAEDGSFPPYGKDHELSIVREWFPTWKEHDAWVAGAAIEVKMYNNWATTHMYETIATAFGKDSETTKNWWHKQMAHLSPRIKEQA